MNRVVDGKEYSKWIVQIPPEQIEKLHWSQGQELDVIIKNNNELIIKSHKK